MVESKEEDVLQVRLRNKALLLLLAVLVFTGCSDSISKISVAGNVPPSPVSNVSTLLINDTYLQVIWDNPKESSLDHHRIYVCENADSLNLISNLYTDALPGNSEQSKQGITIRNLQPATEYKVGIIASNRYGNGKGLQDSIVVRTANFHIEDTEAPEAPALVNITGHLTKGIESATNTELQIEFTPTGSGELITPEIRFAPIPEFANWDAAWPISNPDLFIPEAITGEKGIIKFSFIDAFWPLPFQTSDYEFVIYVKSKDAEGNLSEESIALTGVFKVEVQSGCIKCWNCLDVCPENAISKSSSKAVIDLTKCTRCGNCVLECADDGSEVIFFKTEEVGGI